MRNFRQECYSLAEVIRELSWFVSTQDVDLFQVVDWLHLACGIEAVTFSTVSFDEQFGWCSNADEYFLEQDKLHATLVSGLTRFMFIWNALEVLIEEFVKPPQGQPPGKINDTCRYIKQHFDVNYLPEDYYHILVNFHRRLEKLNSFADQRQKLRTPEDVGAFGYGMYCVYRVRNQIAHGSLYVPEGRGDQEANYLLQLLSFASWIVLRSIQIILIACWEEKGLEVLESSHDDLIDIRNSIKDAEIFRHESED